MSVNRPLKLVRIVMLLTEVKPSARLPSRFEANLLARSTIYTEFVLLLLAHHIMQNTLASLLSSLSVNGTVESSALRSKGAVSSTLLRLKSFGKRYSTKLAVLR